MNFKPLVVFANVYDCEPAINALKQIPADQLHINYYPYPENYKQIELFLESHKSYTHILYVAPDIVLNKVAWQIMTEYILNNNPAVYGCYLQVDSINEPESLACCVKMPTLNYLNRRYRWVKESQRQYFLDHDLMILPVKFNANFAFVRIDVKEKIPYMAIPYPSDERPITETSGGYACDLAFCHYLEALNITPLVDLRVQVQHLRYAGKLLVGIKVKNVKFIPYELI